MGLGLLGSDVTSYARTRLRIDQVSGSLANNVSTYQQLYASDITDLYTLGQQTAGDIDVTHVAGSPKPTPPGGTYTGGATVITGITNPNGTTLIAWRQWTGDSSFMTSGLGLDLGTVGGAPTLPDGYAVPAGSSVVAVELFSNVKPWVLSMMSTSSTVLRSTTLFQPRAALLSQITPGNRP